MPVQCSALMAHGNGGWMMLAMTFPTVTEVPPVLSPVTPPTFVFAAVCEGAPRPSATPYPRRIVD